MTLPPYIGQEEDWIDLPEAAKIFKRTYSCVWKWCHNGVFAEFGIETYRDPSGSWHVKIPKESRQKNNSKVEVGA